MKETTEKIILYCDGACSGNQFKENRGGWGAVLLHGSKKKEIWGGADNTTNNRMELTACLRGLAEIKKRSLAVEVHTDSAYLCNCINQRWYERWRKNGWLTKNRQEVENRDLWECLLALLEQFPDLRFFKVQAHSQDELNHLADALAKRSIVEKRTEEN